MDTIKMGRHGTLRRQRVFGSGSGLRMVTEVKDGEIRLRPAVAGEPEEWSAERRSLPCPLYMP
jgi:hypothetical protein